MFCSEYMTSRCPVRSIDGDLIQFKSIRRFKNIALFIYITLIQLRYLKWIVDMRIDSGRSNLVSFPSFGFDMTGRSLVCLFAHSFRSIGSSRKCFFICCINNIFFGIVVVPWNICAYYIRPVAQIPINAASAMCSKFLAQFRNIWQTRVSSYSVPKILFYG